MAAASHQCLCVCLPLSWALSPHGLALPSHRSPPSGCQWASLRAGVDAGHTGCRGSRQRSPVLDGYPPRGGRAQGGRPRLQGRCPSCRPQVPSSSCGSDVHPHLDRLRPELPAGAWGGAAGGQGPLDGVQSPRRGPGPSMPGSRRDLVAAARRRRARQVWWRGQWGRSFTPSRPWSCRGPCGGLTRRGCCAPGRPPHSPSRGLAIGRAVTAPRKEQWVSLARPRSPGRTASLSQEPWAVWHRRSPGQPSPASLAQCVGVAGAPPVRTSVLHRVAVGWPRPHRVAHRSRRGNPSARGWARGSRVASHARRVTVPSRGTRGHRLHGLVAPRRHAQREKPMQRAVRGSAGSRCSQPGRGRWAGRSVSVAPCRRTGSDDSPSLCHS